MRLTRGASLLQDEAVITPFTLEGRHVRLEPLTLEHVDGLARAGGGERGSFGYTWVPDGPAEADAYVRTALAVSRSVPFAVRRLADDALVGSTRFLDLEVFETPTPWPPGGAAGRAPDEQTAPSVVEIGSTWYAATAQRTAVNTEAKLLLLTHAFEVWRVL